MTLPAQLDPLFLSFQTALAGRYSIDRELGRGGMGIVYLAKEVHLDRMVAIKLLPPDKARDPGVRDGFLREARLAAKLSHPNIIPIHVVDETDGFVFYAMAYVHGETLARRVETRGPLSSSEGARVLREVAWALSHAHSHGLVHRDVKPDNILLEFITGRVLVTDFGIASVVQETAGSTVSGTPEFMSPEQALGKELDARSDLYSLGLTAFYALSGRLAFEGATATEVLAKQVTEPAPKLASMEIPVARKIALLVDRCIAKDPANRPSSADALAEQLGVALEQRRELPAALRNFVKRSSRFNHGGALWMVPFLGVQIVIARMGGMVPALTWMIAGGLGLGFGYLVHAARRLMRLGFGHADVVPGFVVEIEQAQEERAVDYSRRASVTERILKYTAPLAWLTFAGGVAAEIMGRGFISEWLIVGGFLVGVPTAGLYLSLLERRRDIDTEFWGKVWMGRIGKAAFWSAKKLLGKRMPVSAVTHRATELSLGMAAESLFESLPDPLRRQLNDVPALTRRLQTDAQRLRKLYDELQEGLATAGDAALTDAYSALRADRDRVHVKLGEAVGALETIRLNLLRLHAGQGSVTALTTYIDLAAEVSAEAERLLAARREVERALIFPRKIAPTPA